MIRPLTLLSAAAFVVSGAYLFAVKHRAQVLDDQIANYTQATRLDEQRIRVLQAQWALEADPSRLAQLSTQFTTLQPMKPNQLVTLASLGSALPAPGSAAPGPNPEDAVPVLPVATPMPAAVAANAPAVAVVRTAAAQTETQTVTQTEARAPVQLAAALGTAAVKPQVHVASAEVAPGRTHDAHARHKAGAAHEFAENRPAHEHEYAQNSAIYSPQPQAPMGAQVMSVRAVAQAAPVASVPDDGGSLLGMAQSGSGN